MRLIADIDSTGAVTRVMVLEAPNDSFGKYMALVLGKEKYKPALCAGVPCAQQYLFKAKMVRE